MKNRKTTPSDTFCKDHHSVIQRKISRERLKKAQNKKMKNIFSVGQINQYVKNMFTQDFILQKIYVKGEVSNCKYHTSGHIYFSLKDETGVLSCVMFAGHREVWRFA